MRKRLIILMTLSLFATAIPAMALEHGAMHTQHDEECAKECDLLLRNCAQEVDSIQQRIQRIKAAIKVYGAKPENVEDLKILNGKLQETNATLKALTKPGR